MIFWHCWTRADTSPMKLSVFIFDIGSGRPFLRWGEVKSVKHSFRRKNELANELISYNTGDALANLQESKAVPQIRDLLREKI